VGICAQRVVERSVRINICFIYRPIKWTAKIVPPKANESEDCQFVYL
jgi:hypothetical protein